MLREILAEKHSLHQIFSAQDELDDEWGLQVQSLRTLGLTCFLQFADGVGSFFLCSKAVL